VLLIYLVKIIFLLLYGFLCLSYSWMFAFSIIQQITLILLPIMLLYTLLNLRMALGGQTWHERAKCVRTYDLGFWNNARECFGSNWVASCLNPFAKLSLDGDGSRFKRNCASVQTEQLGFGSDFGNAVHRRNMNMSYNL